MMDTKPTAKRSLTSELEQSQAAMVRYDIGIFVENKDSNEDLGLDRVSAGPRWDAAFLWTT